MPLLLRQKGSIPLRNEYLSKQQQNRVPKSIKLILIVGIGFLALLVVNFQFFKVKQEHSVKFPVQDFKIEVDNVVEIDISGFEAAANPKDENQPELNSQHQAVIAENELSETTDSDSLESDNIEDDLLDNSNEDQQEEAVLRGSRTDQLLFPRSETNSMISLRNQIRSDADYNDYNQESENENADKSKDDDSKDLDNVSVGQVELEEDDVIEVPETELENDDNMVSDILLQEVNEMVPNEDEVQHSELVVANEEPNSDIDETESDMTIGEQYVGGPSLGGSFDGETMTIYTQVTLPKKPVYQKVNVNANYSPVSSYLRSKGWVNGPEAPQSKVNMFFTRGMVPAPIKQSRQMVNSIGLSGCIGGGKTLQLACRKKLAEHYGCDFNDLNIQPVQYAFDEAGDCDAFFEHAKKPENAGKYWIQKWSNSFHGAGVSVHRGPGDFKRFSACNKKPNMVIQEYIHNPALMTGGYKFDIRTFMLVASLKPKLVFYHDGFARRSDTVYDLESKNRKKHITNDVRQSSEEHLFDFNSLGEDLTNNMGFPDNFMDSARDYMKKVTKFLFYSTKTQAKPLSNRAGRWHVFGIDWVIDTDRNIHLLEGNGYPLVSYNIRDISPNIWKDMMDLVLTLHTEPEKLGTKMTVADGYQYKGWHLVHNEVEEIFEQNAGSEIFNPCTDVQNNAL